MKPLYIYRIRKLKDGVVAPGVGKKLALHFHPEMGAIGNVVTSLKPKNRLPDGAVVWNYGRSQWPEWGNDFIARGGKIINNPDSVINSVDKARTLNILQRNNIPCLLSTENRDEASKWLEGGSPVIVRHTTTGKMGRGVELVQPGQQLPDAPLYTLFYDKTHEFRVHVVGGEVVDLVQKKRMGEEKRKKFGLEEVNEVVRNHKRGWVFAHNDIYDFPIIRKMGVDATEAVGLDICGVDILAKISNSGELISAVVCECNSAPGMSSPTTFKAYVNAVKERYLDE